MMAIVLLAMASGVIGWKMHKAVEKKQFQSQLERLQTRFTVAQKLAVTMQADWKGVLKKQKKEWVFETTCEEGTARKLSPLHLKAMEVFFDGKKVDELTFDFFSSGKVLPEGNFSFTTPSDKVQWKTSQLFQRQEGKKLGPIHPNENELRK